MRFTRRVRLCQVMNQTQMLVKKPILAKVGCLCSSLGVERSAPRCCSILSVIPRRSRCRWWCWLVVLVAVAVLHSKGHRVGGSLVGCKFEPGAPGSLSRPAPVEASRVQQVGMPRFLLRSFPVLHTLYIVAGPFTHVGNPVEAPNRISPSLCRMQASLLGRSLSCCRNN